MAGVHQLMDFTQAPRGSSRRRIEPSDLAFAKSRRPHIGWQAIANMLGVNQHDLRRHFEHGAPFVQPPAAPAPRKLTRAELRGVPKTTVEKGTIEHRILALIGAGITDAAQIGAAIGRTAKQVATVRTVLRHKTLIDAGQGGGPTVAGWIELSRLGGPERPA